MGFGFSFANGDWTRLRQIIQQLSSNTLGPESSPTFADVTLSDLTASQLVQTDANKALASVADLTNWIAGTANRITVANDGDGTVTLSAPQDIHTGASPTFAGLTITNAAVLGSNSVVFQPNTDSVTFLQVLDADGGTPVAVVDTTNERFGIGTALPSYKFSIGSTDGSDQIGLYHDNTNAYMKWTDGSLYLITDKGTNTNTDVSIRGKGTGRGYLNVWDEDNGEYVSFRCGSGSGYLSVYGASPISLSLQNEADIPIMMFGGATSGETQELQIYGFRAGDALRSLQIGVGVDAADTASFDGVGSYYFDGNVGVGEIPSAAMRLDIVHSQATATIARIWNSDNSGYAEFRARGANANDIGLYGIGGSSVAESDFQDCMYLFAGSHLSNGMRFYINGNTTANMVLNNSGNLVIGNTSASAKLHVDQASTTAAIPVLYLDQADVDQEMIEFNTTIGVGNAIEAVGAKALTTTHFIKVTIPGGLTRYFPVGTIA